MPAHRTTVAMALSLLALAPAGAADDDGSSLSIGMELGATWQQRNTARIPNEPPNTRFDLDAITGDGPFGAGRIFLDWQLNDRHWLRFLVAPLRVDESGTTSEPIVFEDTTFAPGKVDVSYQFDSYRASYRYRFHESEQWSWSVGGTLNIRDARIRLQQPGLSREKSNTGVVPLLALEGEWRFAPGWRGILDFEGLAAPQGRAIDAALKLGYDVTPDLLLTGGYRFLDGGADNDELYTFARFDFAMLGLSWRFR